MARVNDWKMLLDIEMSIGMLNRKWNWGIKLCIAWKSQSLSFHVQVRVAQWIHEFIFYTIDINSWQRFGLKPSFNSSMYVYYKVIQMPSFISWLLIVSHFLKTSIGRSILRFENHFIIHECVFNLKNKMMVEFLTLNCTKIKDIMSSLNALNDYLSIL